MTTASSEPKKIGDNQIANWRKQLSTQFVDALVDEIANEYDNHDYRKWYCWLIYELGPNRVNELRGRAKDADNAGKLFSKLANEELTLKKSRERRNA